VHSFQANTDAKSSDQCGVQSHFRPSKLFETSAEKKELLQHIACKVQMQYSLKVKHSLVPVLVNSEYKEAFVKGIYMERRWKKENGVEMPVIWQGVPGLGFVLLCSKSENYVQAHNVLDVIIQQLEKHLQFLTNPVMALTIVETVALIVNQFLPSGQLLFMNSRLVRQFEKQLELDLFSK
jgi:AP-5 complex subunit sigma-1